MRLLWSAVVGLIIIVVSLVALYRPTPLSASTTGPITGWAWSGGGDPAAGTPEQTGGIGWISLNCVDGGATGNNICGTSNYGLTVAADGTVSGYAWSENVGWISANDGSQGGTNDLAGCPSGPCTAKLSGGAMIGWMRALSGTSAQTGGWDGWISLSGAGYGPQFNADGSFKSGTQYYAWGGDINIGWIDFSRAQLTFTACTVATNYVCVNSSGTQGAGATYNTILQINTDALCQNTYATTSPSCGVGGNFCSAGSAVCVFPAPAGAIRVTPTIVSAGSTVSVWWDAANVNAVTCVVKQAATILSTGSRSGSMTSLPVNSPTTFTFDCTDLSGSTFHAEQSVDVQPAFEEI